MRRTLTVAALVLATWAVAAGTAVAATGRILGKAQPTLTEQAPDLAGAR